VAALGAASWFLARRWRRLARSQRLAAESRDDVVLYAELVSLGIGSGLPFTAAADRAGVEVGGEIGDEARRVLRRARLTGNAEALSASEGRLRPLFALASRATTTGAPLAPAIAGFATDVRKERAAERAAAAKRLPVRLLLPLTLLILPGFVVLTLGSAIVSGLQRIQL